MAFTPVCWDFLATEDPSFPVIPILVGNPQKPESELDWHEQYFKVDTGFAGAIGITSTIINSLELAIEGHTKIVTATGETYVPYYQLLIQNNAWNLSNSLTYAIETPRLLAGRSVLVGKQWLLDFEHERFCYLTDT